MEVLDRDGLFNVVRRVLEDDDRVLATLLECLDDGRRVVGPVVISGDDAAVAVLGVVSVPLGLLGFDMGAGARRPRAEGSCARQKLRSARQEDFMMGNVASLSREDF